MTAYLLTNHLINLVAPAAFVAGLLLLLARLSGQFFKRKRPVVHTWRAQLAIIFAVNLLVLLVGLVVFSHDGKMLSYAAMCLAAAVCHWVLGRGWQD